VARLGGMVPRTLPQASGVGEWCGSAAVEEFAVGLIHDHHDYLPLVHEVQRRAGERLRPQSAAAGFARAVLRHDGR
jgi:hypothetical protein